MEELFDQTSTWYLQNYKSLFVWRFFHQIRIDGEIPIPGDVSYMYLFGPRQIYRTYTSIYLLLQTCAHFLTFLYTPFPPCWGLSEEGSFTFSIRPVPVIYWTLPIFLPFLFIDQFFLLSLYHTLPVTFITVNLPTDASLPFLYIPGSPCFHSEASSSRSLSCFMTENEHISQISRESLLLQPTPRNSAKRLISSSVDCKGNNDLQRFNVFRVYELTP